MNNNPNTEILARLIASELEEQNIPTKEVNVFVKNSREPLAPNIMVFQTFAFLAATRLSPTACKIILLFFSKSAYQNYIGIDLKTISEEISLTVRSVSSAMNELVEQNVLVKHKNPSDKRRNDYFINPLSAWKGNGQERRAAINALSRNYSNATMFGEPISNSKKREKMEIKNKKAMYKLALLDFDNPKNTLFTDDIPNLENETL